jgi:DNA-binding MarR family transcriptional regulator
MPDNLWPHRYRRRVSDSASLRLLAVALHDAGRSLRWAGAPAAGLAPLPPTELEVIRAVGERPGARVSEVAARLGLQGSTAVRSLIDRGLLVREVDPDDRRAVRLRLSPQAEGERACPAHARRAAPGRARALSRCADAGCRSAAPARAQLPA